MTQQSVSCRIANCKNSRLQVEACLMAACLSKSFQLELLEWQQLGVPWEEIHQRVRARLREQQQQQALRIVA
jgi:hypothetical protein